MVLTIQIRSFLTAFMLLITSTAHAGILDFVSDIQKDVQEKRIILKIGHFILQINNENYMSTQKLVLLK